ncbi:hypothetical protein C0Q70_10512 [Pomacea canaliculata]|uniref:HMG box domain-containing protein n=1 Tax=Pomacea canaliculata TaxID=400727 RepID=A0A2T7P3F4_POMCA|nr:hypothetical protein C0Q70_10512 [Pomacea canaliculata]
MAAAFTCWRVIPSVFPKRLVLPINRPVKDVQHLISMSQSTQSSDAPKKPPKPFVKFLKEKISEIKMNDPGISPSEINKTASRMWRQLGPEGQRTYRLQSREEYVDYKKKNSQYLGEEQAAQLDKSAENVSIRKLKRKHEMRILGKPKQPPTAYQMFMRSSWLEQDGSSVAQKSKVLAANWHNMPEEEKKKYEEDARLEKDKYLKELKEWEEQMMGNKHVIPKPIGKRGKNPSCVTFFIPPEFR